MRQYMEGSVTAEQLHEYVVKNNLEEHFEKLGQIDFFSKFLLLPNKKTSDALNQKGVKVAEEYEAIFFPSTTLDRWDRKNNARTKKKIVEDLTNWANSLEERVDLISPEIKLPEMLSLLFDSITGKGNQLLTKNQFKKLTRDKQRFDKNLLELIKFLTDEIFPETDQEFSRRLKLMIVLAIKIKEGYEVVKPVWVRRSEDKWGSKFVLCRKGESNRLDFLSIFDAILDKDEREVLRRSQKIGFNTHADRTESDVHISLENHLGIYILKTPSLVGEELDDIFDREFGDSIKANELTDEMKEVFKAMFHMFDTGTRSKLDHHSFKEKESIHCFGNLYPRLEQNDDLSRKIKPILSNAQKGLKNHNIFTDLVFTTVKADEEDYYWAHCDEWGKNCFYDAKNKIMSWLDFEDSIFTAEGITDFQFSGGRCWKRLISSTEDSEHPKLEHINAISSLGRLITACLQYYSVRDVWREEDKRLSMRPNLCSEVLTVILDCIENWCKEYTKQDHVNMKKRELFPKKIKSQFLLACYDWAVHWDNHRKKKTPVRHRSWCCDKDDNTNAVYHAFTATILNELKNILCKPEDASQDKDDKSSTSDTKASIENKPSQVKENLNVEPSLKSHIKKHISENKSYDVVVWNEFKDKHQNEIREMKETLPKPLASVDLDNLRSLFNIEFQLGNSEEGLVDARSFAAFVNELSQDFDMSQSELIFKSDLYRSERVLAKFQEFVIHDCDGGRKRPNQEIFTIYQQSEKMLIEFLFRIYEPKSRLRRNMIERILRRSIIRRGILDLYLDSKISAECEAYFSAWTKRSKYNFLFDIFRWFWIDDEAERNFMALIRYHEDKQQLEKTRRNIFKKSRSSNQYSRMFISLMDEFVDSKDRSSFVKHGLFEKLVTWELDKRIFLK